MDDRQLIIIGLVVIGIVALWYVANKPQQTTEYDARNFVLNDAKTRFPEAEVSVLSVNYSSNSWKIKVKATTEPTSGCPERIHLYYDYPAMKFETPPQEYITRNCLICINAPDCVIIFPEEALIASHTFPGTERTNAFLKTYPTANGNAEFMENYGNFSKVWLVGWASGASKQTIVLDERGKVLEEKYSGPS
jgi:hypothetical protein